MIKPFFKMEAILKKEMEVILILCVRDVLNRMLLLLGSCLSLS
jgi:hypothetical protein